VSAIAPGPPKLPVPAVALVILDGWGLAPPGEGNAVAQAQTPVFDGLWASYPQTTLSASGRDVGLPEGQMGNSEVGHLNLGAGAVVEQDLSRIDGSIADGSFFENEVLLSTCERAAASPRGRLHLLGLVSDGGVHSGWAHLEATVELAAREGVPELVVHAFTDGRDTLPTSSLGYVSELERWLRQAGRIGTISGRYWAMDRDRHWERTKLAYDAIVHAQGPVADSTESAIREAHASGDTDEFIRPTVINGYDGVADGDVALVLNFRPDRARQLVRALAEPGFGEFARGAAPRIDLSTMTEYQAGWPYATAFGPATPEATLAATVSELGQRQIHVAETEKYAHVTYFFNGGREAEWEGEERYLVDSPRDVATYDERPEMSAAAVAEAFSAHWAQEDYRFGILNFANPDMVGHTGDVAAAITAIETVDSELAGVLEAVHSRGGACIVTADHGNAEHMIEPDGSPNTAHTTNPVPLIVTVPGLELRAGGVLADVAPTALALLGFEQPSAMTGRSLLV
jgi:2,3-bisphosphoglycerate-independent phosphoglycerate mutase